MQQAVLQAKLIIDKYTLTAADDAAAIPQRNWIAWTLYGSDSENGEWTEIHKVVDASLPTENFAASEPFVIENNTAVVK